MKCGIMLEKNKNCGFGLLLPCQSAPKVQGTPPQRDAFGIGGSLPQRDALPKESFGLAWERSKGLTPWEDALGIGASPRKKKNALLFKICSHG